MFNYKAEFIAWEKTKLIQAVNLGAYWVINRRESLGWNGLVKVHLCA